MHLLNNSKLLIASEAAMLDLGAKLANSVSRQFIIYLSGPLGAGKTTLVRGFLQGLGYKDRVKSPSYTLVETYHLKNYTIHHFDFYRVNTPEELEEFGIRDYFSAPAISLIEWPEKGSNRLPIANVICDIKVVGQGREVSLSSQNIT